MNILTSSPSSQYAASVNTPLANSHPELGHSSSYDTHLSLQNLSNHTLTALDTLVSSATSSPDTAYVAKLIKDGIEDETLGILLHTRGNLYTFCKKDLAIPFRPSAQLTGRAERNVLGLFEVRDALLDVDGATSHSIRVHTPNNTAQPNPAMARSGNQQDFYQTGITPTKSYTRLPTANVHQRSIMPALSWQDAIGTESTKAPTQTRHVVQSSALSHSSFPNLKQNGETRYGQQMTAHPTSSRLHLDYNSSSSQASYCSTHAMSFQSAKTKARLLKQPTYQEHQQLLLSASSDLTPFHHNLVRRFLCYLEDQTKLFSCLHPETHGGCKLAIENVVNDAILVDGHHHSLRSALNKMLNLNLKAKPSKRGTVLHKHEHITMMSTMFPPLANNYKIPAVKSFFNRLLKFLEDREILWSALSVEQREMAVNEGIRRGELDSRTRAQLNALLGLKMKSDHCCTLANRDILAAESQNLDREKDTLLRHFLSRLEFAKKTWLDVRGDLSELNPTSVHAAINSVISDKSIQQRTRNVLNQVFDLHLASY